VGTIILTVLERVLTSKRACTYSPYSSVFSCSQLLTCCVAVKKAARQQSEVGTDVADALMDDVDNDVTSCRIIDVIH